MQKENVIKCIGSIGDTVNIEMSVILRMCVWLRKKGICAKLESILSLEHSMRVLDLDLDFFLADCCPLAEIGCRPELQGHEPWPRERVRAFLEQQCGLNKQHPVPGRIFETHDQALFLWEERIAQGKLTVPFHVTHVDAHSDLGIGAPGPGYVLYNVLAMSPHKRLDAVRFKQDHKLDEANYLLFALAMRRISSLENVRNPLSRPDIPQALLAQDVPDTIRMTSMTAQMFEKQNGREPDIPFTVYPDHTTFQASQPYDLVSLAISPRYAPREADELVKVIA